MNRLERYIDQHGTFGVARHQGRLFQSTRGNRYGLSEVRFSADSKHLLYFPGAYGAPDRGFVLLDRAADWRRRASIKTNGWLSQRHAPRVARQRPRRHRALGPTPHQSRFQTQPEGSRLMLRELYEMARDLAGVSFFVAVVFVGAGALCTLPRPF
jgi:hypothetical protein